MARDRSSCACSRGGGRAVARGDRQRRKAAFDSVGCRILWFVASRRQMVGRGGVGSFLSRLCLTSGRTQPASENSPGMQRKRLPCPPRLRSRRYSHPCSCSCSCSGNSGNCYRNTGRRTRTPEISAARTQRTILPSRPYSRIHSRIRNTPRWAGTCIGGSAIRGTARERDTKRRHKFRICHHSRFGDQTLSSARTCLSPCEKVTPRIAAFSHQYRLTRGWVLSLADGHSRLPRCV